MKKHFSKTLKASLATFLLTALSLFANQDYKIVVDQDNAEIKVPLKVEKVVNLWPSFNGSMILLGAGSKLSYPRESIKAYAWGEFFVPGLKNRPTAIDNIEELLVINPDLIVSKEYDFSVNARRVGLPTIYLRFHDNDGLKKSVRILGEALGGEFVQKSIDWEKQYDENIAEVQKAVGHLKEDEKPIVHYIFGIRNEGLYATMGMDSFQRRWVELAGGRYSSVLLNLESSEVSAEAILSLNPDVIIIGGAFQHEIYKSLMADPAWKDIKAVKNKRVHTNPHGVYGWDRHGAESILQVPFAATVINPHLYKKDILKMAIDTYEKFTGVKLTKKQAQNMIDGYGPNGGPVISPSAIK